MAETLPRASLLRWGVRLGAWLFMFLVAFGLHFGLSWAQSIISPAARKKAAIAQYFTQRPKQRVLAGIILGRPYGWFFKVSGPDDVVGPQKGAFETFLKSVKLARAGEDPTWTLPEGWQQQEGNQMRFATIQMGSSDAPLEMTVTQLPVQGDEVEYVLRNVNRWRGELGLTPLDAADLDKQTTQLKGGERDITLVDMFAYLDGTPAQPGNVYTRTVEELEEVARMRGEEPEQQEVKFTLPRGWKQTAPGTLQIHRFVVGDGKDPVEISISSAGGDLAANINRWRGQVGLGPMGEEEMASSLTDTKVFDLKAGQIEIIGPPGEKQQAILGVIAPSGRTNWFIKLKGPVKPALAEKKNFEEFVKSLKLE